MSIYHPDSIKAQLATLEEISVRLDAARTALLDKFTELSAFLCCMPFPAWIKNKEARMIYVNRAYENAFKITLEEYNQKFDADVWSSSAARRAAAADYLVHDLFVMEQKQPLRTTEYYVDEEGTSVEIDVLKWGLLNEAGQIIGVAGMVTTPIV